ncbi:MAG: PRC-barrel domain-containing protein [Sphingomonas sp.]|uniref:PRC-barrel domain-containing protein n=1 Tax=Sphingomonas sp. TaxID=28214 RepID=UPI001AC1CA68|nr:PRC-barrel domain-containing protein [Sphingomonas sp.]MBN8808196.1 PRC-barrel domain-containing protein [Sphingomonas sp.]
MAAPAPALKAKAAEQLGRATRFTPAPNLRKERPLSDHLPAPLIGATLTETMKVRDRDGRSLGSVYGFMVHKRSARALYAVLSLGGFLGVGGAYYPVPITLLTYDPAGDGYVTAIDPKALEGGPSWSGKPPAFDQDYADRVASYYGAERQSLSIG